MFPQYLNHRTVEGQKSMWQFYQDLSIPCAESQLCHLGDPKQDWWVWPAVKLTCLHMGLQLDSPWRETDWLPLQMEINHKFLHVYRQGFMSISALLFWNIRCNYGETRPLRVRAALLWQVHFLLHRVGVHKGDLHISAPAQITASCFSALFKHAKQRRHCLAPRH